MINKKEEFNEEIYKSLFRVTELALVLLRRYSEGVEKITLFDTIKQITHRQKKIARKELEENLYDDYCKFLKGVFKENCRKIILKTKIAIQSYGNKNNLPNEEVEIIFNSIKAQLEDTSKEETKKIVELYINKIGKE